jgi:hypothetical protein
MGGEALSERGLVGRERRDCKLQIEKCKFQIGGIDSDYGPERGAPFNS